MAATPETGFLVIADLTGYTAYLSQSELGHPLARCRADDQCRRLGRDDLLEAVDRLGRDSLVELQDRVPDARRRFHSPTLRSPSSRHRLAKH